MARAIVTLPSSAVVGEVIEVRALIAHPMETGYRNGDDGQRLTRNLIRRFECHYLGDLVFAADLFAAVAANPLISFSLRASATGMLRLRWVGDKGFEQVEERLLTVR